MRYQIRYAYSLKQIKNERKEDWSYTLNLIICNGQYNGPTNEGNTFLDLNLTPMAGDGPKKKTS